MARPIPRPALAFLTLPCLLTVCFTGCAIVRSSQNEPIDPALLRDLNPGTTTARDVVERLGAPSQVVELGARSAYRYDHSMTKGAGVLLIIFILGNADTRSDRIWLFFDENDVLTHVGATLAAHRPQYAMPWEDIHEESDTRMADLNRPGLVDGDRE